MAQEAPCSLDIQDIQFKLHCKQNLFKNVSLIQNPVHLLTVSSNVGLLFAAHPNALELRVSIISDVVQSKESGRSVLIRCVSLPNVATSIECNADGSMLAISYMLQNSGFVQIYNVQSFLTSNIITLCTLRVSPENDVGVTKLLWNPVISNNLAVVLNNGALMMYTFKEGGQFEMHSLDKSQQVKCGCWSPKGKQIVLGFPSGKLQQFKPDLTPARAIQCPTGLFAGPFDTIAIQWLSTYQFAVAYLEKAVDTTPNIFIINAPKAGNPQYINYYDICYSLTGPRLHQVNFLHVPQWNILLVASANGVEIGVLGTKETTDIPKWQQYMLIDEARIEMPLTENKDETFPIGFGLDISSTHQLTIGEKLMPIMPMIHFLSSHGQLLCFNFLNLSPGAVNICSPPVPATDRSGEFRPLNEFNTATTSSTTTVAATPIAEQTIPSKSMTSFVSTTSPLTSTPTLKEKLTPTFGNMSNVEGNIGFGSLDGAPLNFGMKNMTPTFGIKTTVPPTIGTSSPFTTVPPTIGTSSPFTTVPPTIGTSSPFTTVPPTIGTSSPFSNIGVPPANCMPSSLPATIPPPVENINLTVKPIQNPINSPIVAQSGTTTNKPLYTVPSTFTATLKKKEKTNEKSNIDSNQSNEMDELIKEMIAIQIDAFSKELQHLDNQSKVLLANLGNLNDMKVCTKRLNDLQEIIDQANNRDFDIDVQNLRQSLNEIYIMITECRSKLEMYNNPEITRLTSLSTSDPVYLRQLAKLQCNLSINQLQFNQMQQLLDAQWSNHQDVVHRNAKSKIHIPSLDGIYQRMTKLKDTISRQRTTLNSIQNKLKANNIFYANNKKKDELNITNQFESSSTTMDSIADSILSMSLVHTVNENRSRLSTEKLTGLRKFTQQRQTITIIKPQRPDRVDVKSEVILETKLQSDRKARAKALKDQQLLKQKEEKEMQKQKEEEQKQQQLMQQKQQQQQQQQLILIQQQKHQQQQLVLLQQQQQQLQQAQQQQLQQAKQEQQQQVQQSQQQQQQLMKTSSGGNIMNLAKPTPTKASPMTSVSAVSTTNPTNLNFGSLSSFVKTSTSSSNFGTFNLGSSPNLGSSIFGTTTATTTTTIPSFTGIKPEQNVINVNPSPLNVTPFVQQSNIAPNITGNSKGVPLQTPAIKDNNDVHKENDKALSLTTSTVATTTTTTMASNAFGSTFSFSGLSSTAAATFGAKSNLMSTTNPAPISSTITTPAATSLTTATTSALATSTSSPAIAFGNKTDSANKSFSFGAAFNIATSPNTSTTTSTTTMPNFALTSKSVSTPTSTESQSAKPLNDNNAAANKNVDPTENLFSSLTVCKPTTNEKGGETPKSTANIFATLGNAPATTGFGNTLFGDKPFSFGNSSVTVTPTIGTVISGVPGSTTVTTTTSNVPSPGTATITVPSVTTPITTAPVFIPVTSQTPIPVSSTIFSGMTSLSNVPTSTTSTVATTSTTRFSFLAATADTTPSPITTPSSVTTPTKPAVSASSSSSFSTPLFAGIGTATSATTTTGTAGLTSSSGNSIFGGISTTPITTPKTGNISSGLFASIPKADNPATTPPEGLFSAAAAANPSPFSSPTTGNNPISGANLFGAKPQQPQQQQQPSPQQTGNIFGGTNTSSGGSIFGGASTASSPFTGGGGGGSSGGTLFAATGQSAAPPFSQTSSTSSTMGGNIFATAAANPMQPQQTAATGFSSSGSLFGGTATNMTSIFGGGSSGSTTSPFGGVGGAGGGGGGGNFGSFGQQIAPQFGSTGNAFGQNTGGTVAQSGFGSPSQDTGAFSNSMFGSSTGFGGSPTFGGTATFGGGATFGSPKPFGFGAANTPNSGSAFTSPTTKNNLFETLGSNDSGLSFGNLAQTTNANQSKSTFRGSSFMNYRA